MIDDLERLLGYVEAVDQACDFHIVGHELVAMSCWTPAFCNAVIRAAELTGAFRAHPQDPVPAHEVSLAVISPGLFSAVEADFGSRLWPQLERHWPLIEYRGIQDVFVIKYEIGQQEELRLHHDISQLSGSIKLNSDYQGAELEFPRQNFTNHDIPLGHMLVWPSLVTHPHRSAPILGGVKYSATVWFELPLINQ